ncbi:MAG: tripartite tricarboxylate transporter TctB family protein [Pseudomonadota bacterium]
MTSRLPGIMFGAVLALLGAGFYFHTYSERYVGLGIGAEFGPMFYPRIILGIWVVIAVAAAIEAALVPSPAGATPKRWGTAAVIGGLIVLAIAAMPYAGFLASMMTFFLIAVPVLGYRKPLPWLLAGIGFPTAIWYLFHEILVIRLPTGSLFETL